MCLSISVTSFLIYLHLSVYLCSLQYHQMLISTGILADALSQSSLCERSTFPTLLLKRMMHACVTLYHTAGSAEGLVIRWGCASKEKEEQAQSCECSALDFWFIFFSIPVMRACSTGEMLYEWATRISQRTSEIEKNKSGNFSTFSLKTSFCECWFYLSHTKWRTILYANKERITNQMSVRHAWLVKG